jgi:thiol:disulfide interchange protein DsbD
MKPGISLLAILWMLLLSGGVSHAASQRATVSATLNTTALQPGQQAVVAVVVNVEPGYHAQSHTPSQEGLIPFEASAQSAKGVQFYAPIYPKGHDQSYPALGTLNVYTGQAIVYIPVKVDDAATIGAFPLEGTVSFQICDDRVCYAPQKLSWHLDTSIVPPGQTVAADRPELFKSFDFATFGKLSQAPPEASAPSAAAQGAELALFGWHFHLAANEWFLAFLAAFGVGIIFNLMPCVLPVVPLKAVGFYEVSQHHRGRSFFLGLVFSAGILAAFAVLALLLFVFKSLTWGEQFSRPWFVWSIVVILVVMALGMFGTFTFILPTKVYSFVPSHQTITGNFLFGVLATILSTPCTAPMFVGLLIWAGGQPQSIAIGLVMTVGLGMAFPYLVLSALPEVARKLPRTGVWSELLKQMMGFLLLAVAVYFAGGRLVSGRSFIWWVFAVLAAAGLFLILRTLQFTRRPAGILTAVVLAGLITGLSLWFTLKLTRSGIPWQPYSAQALASARADGKIVMVEFTANWCANCLALEAQVFNDPAAVAAVRRSGAVTLRADLSSEDAAGWALLRQLNASGGIPLTAIYAPGSDVPIQLSSIYQTRHLEAALRQAADKQGPTARAHIVGQAVLPAPASADKWSEHRTFAVGNSAPDALRLQKGLVRGMIRK